jgi:hypothetical protein
MIFIHSLDNSVSNVKMIRPLVVDRLLRGSTIAESIGVGNVVVVTTA